MIAAISSPQSEPGTLEYLRRAYNALVKRAEMLGCTRDLSVSSRDLAESLTHRRRGLCGTACCVMTPEPQGDWLQSES